MASIRLKDDLNIAITGTDRLVPANISEFIKVKGSEWKSGDFFQSLQIKVLCVIVLVTCSTEVPNGIPRYFSIQIFSFYTNIYREAQSFSIFIYFKEILSFSAIQTQDFTEQAMSLITKITLVAHLFSEWWYAFWLFKMSNK